MSNLFYAPGERRAGRVRDLFAAIAPRYDRVNDFQSFGLHRRWKRRMVKLADVKPDDRALDVCCGTGDIAIALAAGGARVAALDFSAPMLEVAAGRVRQWEFKGPGSGIQSRTSGGPSGERRPRTLLLVRGDAQQIPFPDSAFDIITVGYGLRNLASWETGLREMIRVARPGGRVVVLDFGKPRNVVWRAIYYSYLKCFVPALGWLVCGRADAYAYILESLKHYPAQAGVAAKMRELGLIHVRLQNLFGGAMSINYGEKCPAARAHLDPATKRLQAHKSL